MTEKTEPRLVITRPYKLDTATKIAYQRAQYQPKMASITQKAKK